jgi:hemolysin activation/secretion protein
LPGRIEAIEGPKALSRYFASLVGAPVLHANALEPARALASVHAARSDQNLQLQLLPGSEPGHFRLRLDQAASQPASPRWRLQLGNPGNRFVGREFAEAESRLGGGGSELRVTRRQSLEGEQVYREHAGSVGVVVPAGLFGAEGRRADYTQRQGEASLAGRVSSVTLRWSVLPHADFQTRWVAGVALSAARDQVIGIRPLLEQSFTAAQFSLSRAHRAESTRWPLEWQISAIADLGLHGEFADASGAALPTARFLSLRPSLGLQLHDTPFASWAVGLDVLGQLTTDTLPQQQQWVLGGDQALAAWLPGVIVGDRGYLLRMHLGRRYGGSTWTLRPRLFVEAGGGTLDRGDAGSANSDLLADASIELGLEYDRHFAARIVAATPLVEPGSLRRDLAPLRANLFFQLSLSF